MRKFFKKIKRGNAKGRLKEKENTRGPGERGRPSPSPSGRWEGSCLPYSSLRDCSQSQDDSEEGQGPWPSNLQGECGLWLLKTLAAEASVFLTWGQAAGAGMQSFPSAQLSDISFRKLGMDTTVSQVYAPDVTLQKG